jgi:hypothetical protein
MRIPASAHGSDCATETNANRIGTPIVDDASELAEGLEIIMTGQIFENRHTCCELEHAWSGQNNGKSRFHPLESH